MQYVVAMATQMVVMWMTTTGMLVTDNWTGRVTVDDWIRLNGENAEESFASQKGVEGENGSYL